MKPLAIMVTGEPLKSVLRAHGSFVEQIRRTVGGAWHGPWDVVDARAAFVAGAALLPADGFAGVVVSGSHASLTEGLPWMATATRWLRHALDIGKPVLGLCFGHQLLGHVMGGEVLRRDTGPEYGTVPLEMVEADELLGPVPATPPRVNMLHEDSVVGLPQGAVVLARTAHEPHAALRFGPRAWGVQFHPEFDDAALRTYLRTLRKDIARAGRDPDALLKSTAPTPWAAALLRRFAKLVAKA